MFFLKRRFYVVFLISFFSVLSLRAIAQASIIWGVAKDGQVVVTTAEKSDRDKPEDVWEQVEVKNKAGDVLPVKKIAVGANLQPWVVTSDNSILWRTGVSAGNSKGVSWQRLGDRKLLDIAVGPDGQVWGVTPDNNLVFREGVFDNDPDGQRWIAVDGSNIKQIVVGANNNVWMINRDDKIFVRTGLTSKNNRGTGWVQVSGKLATVSIGAQGFVWGIDDTGRAVFRQGVTPQVPQGTAWKIIDGPVYTREEMRNEAGSSGSGNIREELLGKVKSFLSLSVGPDFQVWGITFDFKVYKRIGVTPTNVLGSSWGDVSGDLINIALSSYPGEVAGGNVYTHNGPKIADDTVVFHEAWKFKQPGTGWVKFRARSQAELYVQFSSELASVAGRTYHVTIGGENNTVSVMNKLDGKQDALSDINKGGNIHSVVTGGVPQDGVLWDDYWVSVDHGIVRWGKAKDVYDGEHMRLIDEDALENVLYVGLGGSKNFVHEFKNIYTSGMPDPKVMVNLPEGFTQVGGKAYRISVGSTPDGKLLVMAIGVDFGLYRYDAISMDANPWIKIDVKDKAGEEVLGFKDISVASDGTACVLSSDGIVYQYDWDHDNWFEINRGQEHVHVTLDRIAVGNSYCMWGLDKATRSIYQLLPDGWKERGTDAGMALSVGFDGTVVVINQALETYMFDYKDGSWDDFANTVRLGRIAVGNRKYMWGTHAVGVDFQIWYMNNGVWTRAQADDKTGACGFKQTSVNAAGTVLAIDFSGNIYKRGERGVLPKEISKILEAYKKSVGIKDREDKRNNKKVKKKIGKEKRKIRKLKREIKNLKKKIKTEKRKARKRLRKRLRKAQKRLRKLKKKFSRKRRKKKKRRRKRKRVGK